MRCRKDKKRRSKLRGRQRQEKAFYSSPSIEEEEVSPSETETVEESLSDSSDYAYSSCYFDGHWHHDSEYSYAESDGDSCWGYPESEYDDDYILMMNAESNKSYKMLRIPAIVLDGLFASPFYIDLPDQVGLFGLPVEIQIAISRSLPPIARCSLAVTCRWAARVACENDFLDLLLTELTSLGSYPGLFRHLVGELDDMWDSSQDWQYPPGRKNVKRRTAQENLWSELLSEDIIQKQCGWYTPGIHDAVGHWSPEQIMLHTHQCSCHHKLQQKACHMCQLIRRDEDCVEEAEMTEDETNVTLTEERWLKGKFVFADLELVSGKRKPNGRSSRKGKVWY